MLFKNFNVIKFIERVIIMKFTKGLLVGGLITTGILLMYNDNNMMSKNKMIKKGKQFAKKMGVL